jgi:hypothetical protein
MESYEKKANERSDLTTKYAVAHVSVRSSHKRRFCLP